MGGGGGNDVAKQQAAEEAARQAQIAAATDRINAIFDDPSRTAEYNKLASDTTAYYMQDLNKQKAINDRNMRFALARGGQIGGSVQTDEAKNAGEDYLRGVVEASRRGQAAGAALRGEDEQERANLIALAQSGMSMSQASQAATSALQANLQSQQATATANSLGDAFGDFADLYQRSKDAADTRRGYLYGYGSIFGPTSTTPYYGGH